jgi:hypothetical protein
MDEELTREEKLWIAWLLTTGISFAMLEGYAIKNRKTKGTLTYTLRKSLGLHPVKPWRLLGASAVCGASAWFAVHITTGRLVPKIMSTLEGKEHGELLRLADGPSNAAHVD